MSIEELKAIVEPPEHPSEVPTHPDWGSVEDHLRVNLPQDYCDFISAYGSGLLGNVIRVFNPFASSEYLALVPCVERICAIRREAKETEGDEEVPFDVYPVSPGIMPWGNDENGNTLYWLIKGGPDKWPTIVGEGRGRRWEQFDFPMSTFLARALKGAIKCEIWPSDFPNPPDDYVFESY